MAPSAEYPEASVFEGQVPGDKLPDLHDPMSDQAEARKKLPNMNDPFSVISYLFGTLIDRITGKEKPSPSQSKSKTKPGKDNTWTGVATFFSLVVLICTCCCLCSGTMAYISYQGNRYLDDGGSLSKSGIKRGTTPIVKSSKKRARVTK